MKSEPKEIVQIVLKIIWGIIKIAITLFVLVNVLFFGGCYGLGLALKASEEVQNGIDAVAVQQARRALLPPLVRRIVDSEDTGGRNIYDPRWGAVLAEENLSPPQDPSGRYVLTSEGLIDFATASLTKLDCPGLSSGTDRVIIFRKHWLDDRLFIWGRCVFDLETLQSGAIEELWCAAGRSGCSHAELLDALAGIIPETERVYVNGTRNFDEEHLLVDLSSDGRPVHLWREQGLPTQNVTALIEQAGLMIIPAPSQDGRTILPGVHRLSPNGEYDASVDDNTLVIQRAQDGSPVIEVRADAFHQTFATSRQRMYGLGWTDDSRQVIFLIETYFNDRRSLAQIFVLMIP
jgi:hypothetical protein